jgi:hypothetical protein
MTKQQPEDWLDDEVPKEIRKADGRLLVEKSEKSCILDRVVIEGAGNISR